MKFLVREFQRAWKRDYKRLWTKAELDAGRRGFEQAEKQAEEVIDELEIRLDNALESGHEARKVRD